MNSPAGPALGTALDPCVHCGFCLPACPTYLATGDEAESPRGRIVLMRALERSELDAADTAARAHLDHCLGCRGCEPACPSGVQYGRGLEETRAWLAGRNGLPLGARIVLGVFARGWLWRPLLTLARWLRDAGLAAALTGTGRVGFGFAMLAASGDGKRLPRGRRNVRSPDPSGKGPAALFAGCVMSTLFSHVNAATARALAAEGYAVAVPPRQGCCGALHAHAGDIEGARRLARANVAAFEGTEVVAVNSAGCGALLKDYGHLLGTPEGARFAARVRDISELLDGGEPAAPTMTALRVGYDAPCHLQHAQGVTEPPLRMLQSVPGLSVVPLPGYDRCCGSAGIFSLLEPAMSRAVLEAKIAAIAGALPDVVATGNPGCLMQIGAGLRASGRNIPVVHPLELFDAAPRSA